SSVKLMANAMPSLSVTATTRDGVAETAGIGSGGAGVTAGADGDDAAEDGGTPAGAAAGTGVGAGAGTAAYFAGIAFGSRMASMMFSRTPALESRMTSCDERLNAVFELRIWLRIMAGETFASII